MSLCHNNNPLGDRAPWATHPKVGIFWETGSLQFDGTATI
jgi:hypothetical protein